MARPQPRRRKPDPYARRLIVLLAGFTCGIATASTILPSEASARIAAHR